MNDFATFKQAVRKKWADIATGSMISLWDPDNCYGLWADETTFAYEIHPIYVNWVPSSAMNPPPIAIPKSTKKHPKRQAQICIPCQCEYPLQGHYILKEATRIHKSRLVYELVQSIHLCFILKALGSQDSKYLTTKANECLTDIV